MWGDPAVTRHLGGGPFTAEETWSRLLRYVGHWTLLGFGYWIVEERESGRFAGEVGFADYRRDVQPSLAGMPEIGWVLPAHAHGKGYATEAAQAAVAWGERYFGAVRTACIVAPGNAASIRVAEKCGYREWQRGTYKEHATLICVRDPAETNKTNKPR